MAHRIMETYFVDGDKGGIEERGNSSVSLEVVDAFF